MGDVDAEVGVDNLSVEAVDLVAHARLGGASSSIGAVCVVGGRAAALFFKKGLVVGWCGKVSAIDDDIGRVGVGSAGVFCGRIYVVGREGLAVVHSSIIVIDESFGAFAGHLEYNLFSRLGVGGHLEGMLIRADGCREVGLNARVPRSELMKLNKRLSPSSTKRSECSASGQETVSYP